MLAKEAFKQVMKQVIMNDTSLTMIQKQEAVKGFEISAQKADFTVWFLRQ